MKKIVKSIIRYIMYSIITLYALTWRIRYINRTDYDKFRSEKLSFVVPIWHNSLLQSAFAYRNNNIVTMASNSKDGDLIAGLMKFWGFVPARGSSSKGGIKATLHLIKECKERKTLTAITVDGPRGPVYKIKDGVIFIAKKLDKIIIPSVARVSHGIRFNSWDKLCLPLPFSKVEIIFGKSIYLDDDLTHEALERDRESLEKIMLGMNNVYS